ncbi:hypothetical protein M2282_000027 [Variovorax boronicumulans]|uniref:hypothetical protein n=1 Tax=Variovorax boronicumulans TaxID=436515 RepID=UPI0024756815|nr:hypothetical protein [Variovorax boronicumulans]MDH6164899.1 hypothetical protein [Variovorax boronicumulans]
MQMRPAQVREGGRPMSFGAPENKVSMSAIVVENPDCHGFPDFGQAHRFSKLLHKRFTFSGNAFF